MDITKLMADTAARDIYLATPADSDPLKLAQDYMLARLQKQKSACLALEYFIRDLARMHFNKPAVLEALRIVEKYKFMRVPGKGGDADCKRIARAVEVAAATGDYTLAGDGRAVFQVDTLRLKCQDNPAAIAWLVAKYRGGFPKPKSVARMRADGRR